MGRNYRNESEWQKQKYTLVKAYIDKDQGEKLKAKLKKEGRTMADWIKECTADYLHKG